MSSAFWKNYQRNSNFRGVFTQLCNALKTTLPDKNSLYYFVGIDNCRFKNPVLPGDTISLEVEIDRVRGGVWKYRSVARVEENICAEATILCALRKASE